MGSLIRIHRDMKHLKLFEGFENTNKVYYHGSAKRFDEFKSSISNYNGTIYFTESKLFAMQFAQDRGGTGYLYSVNLSYSNPFNATLSQKRDELIPILIKLIEDGYEDPITGAKFRSKFIVLNGESIKEPSAEQSLEHILWRLEHGSWRILESEPIIDFIRSKGYDALITVEKGQENVADWDSELIRILDVENI
jgi:hypothetical protein